MTTAATISARLILDQSDYDTGLKQAGDKADTFEQKLKQVGGKLSHFGANMTAFVTTPVLAGFAGMISAASDLNESANAVNVVFEDSAGIMKEFGEVAAETVGLSKSEFNELGSVTGAFLTNFGFDQKEAAEETIALTKRASDMASIFNKEVPEAMFAMQAALRGETEPIRQFGVMLNQASIEAKAVEMGLIKAGDEMTMQAKAQATLALIYEQTNKFAGDFVNTSDQLANGTRVLKAQLKDEAAALGTELLPLVLKAVTFFRGLITTFKELSPETKKWILIALGIIAVLGPILMFVGALITAIGAIIPVVTAVGGALAAVSAPVILIILAVIAALALLYLAWVNNWGGIRDKFEAFVAWFKPIWDSIWQGAMAIFDFFRIQFNIVMQAWQAAVRGDWHRFGELLRMAWDRMWHYIGLALQNAGQAISQGISTLVQNIITFFTTTDWGAVGKNIIIGIINGLNALESWATNAIRNLAANMADAFMGFFGIHSPSKWAEEQMMMIKAGFQGEWMREPLVLAPSPILAGMPVPMSTASASSTVTERAAPSSSPSTNQFDYDRFARILAAEVQKVL